MLQNGTNSDIMNIICGVSPGSIMGPLLFLLYINDLPELFKVSLGNTANQATVYGPSKSLSTLRDNLNKLNDWLCANKLSLNINKTNFIVVSLKPLTHPVNKEINGIRIKRELSIKFLGVYIDQTFNWGEHCKMQDEIVFFITCAKLIYKYFPNRTAKKNYTMLFSTHI